MALRTFYLPDLGEGLTEAEVLRWLVAVGDTIVDDQPVVEVETAKSSVEVPAPYAGVVQELHSGEGQVVAVGDPLIAVMTEDAAGQQPAPAPDREETGGDEAGGGPDAPGSGPDAGDTGPVEDAAAAQYVEEERAGSGSVLVGYGTAEDAGGRRRGRRGRRQRLAGEDGAAAASEGPASGATQAQPGSRPRVASPVVRRLAKDRGVDLWSLEGTGTDGVITRGDVESTAAEAPQSEPPAPEGVPAQSGTGAASGPGETTAAGGVRQRIPITGIRKAIGERLTTSRREIPEATTWVDVDATALLALRQDVAGQTGEKPPSILAFVARFVVAGLARYPEVNASVDTEREEIVQHAGVGLGIAAQTDSGLMVPVVTDAHTRSVRDLDAEIRRLTALARDGRLASADLKGGTFTLNNYGVFGVDGSAAIINHPEAGILGVGRIIDRPWVVDGQVQPRNIVQLSLVFDHRVCDGGTAAGLLRFVADCIERPTVAVTDL